MCAVILQQESASYAVGGDDAARLCLTPVSPGTGGPRPEKVLHAGLIHAAANFASFLTFRGLAINESTF